MGTATAATDLQQAYERAFQEFSDRVRALQCLTLHPSPDAAAINVALLELEKAHWVYDRCRDALAVELLPASMRGTFRRMETQFSRAPGPCPRRRAIAVGKRRQT